MKSGKLVLAGIASVMLVSAAAIPSLAQQANGEKMPGPRGPMAYAFMMLDTNKDGKITRDEFEADKAKIFAEIDKNGDKKLSYDEVKAWSKDVMAKMAENNAGPDEGPDAPPPPPRLTARPRLRHHRRLMVRHRHRRRRVLKRQMPAPMAGVRDREVRTASTTTVRAWTRVSGWPRCSCAPMPMTMASSARKSSTSWPTACSRGWTAMAMA